MLIGVLMVLLVACGGADDAANWVAFESDSLGLAFEQPESWVTREENGTLALANAEQTFDGNVADGAMVTFLTGTTQEFGISDPVQILSFFTDAFVVVGDDGTDVTVVEAIRPITLNNYQGASTTLRGTISGQDGLFRFMTLRTGERVVLLMIAEVGDGRYAEAIEQVVQSIEIVE
jgi:hypothetical protein